MRTHEIQDMFHFISIEEENLLKSLANFQRDTFFIQELDELYKSCFSLNPINDKKLKIPAFLYTNVHRELYITFVSFLRLLQSKSFNSLRCAIDSALTAYYLVKYPDKRDVYLSKMDEKADEAVKKEWNKIFRNIKKTIKDNLGEFPFSNNLPDMHEFCSIFAHSDALGLMHRYVENAEELRVEGKYFDYEAEMNDYKRWFGCLLEGYFKIFLMFWNILFKGLAGEKLAEIEPKIKRFAEELTKYRNVYPLRKQPDAEEKPGRRTGYQEHIDDKRVAS